MRNALLVAFFVAVPLKAQAFVFRPDQPVTVDRLFVNEAAAFGLGPDDSMKERDVIALGGNLLMHKFHRYTRGLEVVGVAVTVYSRDGFVTAANGIVVPPLSLSIAPSHSEASAYQAARLATAERTVFGDAAGETRSAGELVIAYGPTDSARRAPQLVYRFWINGASTRHLVDIDAHDLHTLRHSETRSNMLASAALRSLTTPSAPPPPTYPPNGSVWKPATAVAITVRDNKQDLQIESTQYNHETYYRLQGTNGKSRVEAWDLNGTTNLSTRTPLLISAGNCGQSVETCGLANCAFFDDGHCALAPQYPVPPGAPTPLPLRAGATAYWAAQRTSEYYVNKFSRRGIDDNWGTVAVDIDLLQPSPNSAYEKTQPIPGEVTTDFSIAGKDSWGNSWHEFVDLDFVAHELTHAVEASTIEHGLGFAGASESGALAEGFADVFAQLVEFDTRHAFDWKMGEAIVAHPGAGVRCYRNIDHPFSGPGYPNDPILSPNTTGCLNSYYNPNTYQGTLWDTHTYPCTDVDNCGSHTNGNVIAYWLYLLVTGCDPQTLTCINNAPTPQTYHVDKISVADAQTIAYNALRASFHSYEYQDVRDASVTFTAQYFGADSPQQISVVNAWHAVNLGPEYQEPAFSPAQAATNVEPWKTSFDFELGQQATASCGAKFAVEVGTTADMADATATDAVTPYMVNGVYHAKVDATLKPSTTYYWRIRAAILDQGGSCTLSATTRPVHSFTTSAKKPSQLAPDGKDGCVGTDKGDTSMDCDPWGLIFSWKAVPSADTYDLQIATDSHFDDATFYVTSQPVQDTWLKTNVLVGKQQSWRVRACGIMTMFNELPADNCGDWAMETFQAKVPASAVLAPFNQSTTVHPWYADHRWKVVTGADWYEVSVDRYENNALAEHLLSNEQHTGTELVLVERVKPQGTDHYKWQVVPRGPKMPCLGDMREPGATLQAEYGTDGEKTVPLIVLPADQACNPAEQAVAVKWNAVDWAVGYLLTVTEVLCPLNHPCVQGQTVTTLPISVVASQATYTQSVPYGIPASQDVNSMGFVFSVLAVGPNGAIGLHDAQVQTYIDPSHPALQYPPDGGTVSQDGMTVFQWSSGMADGGGFIFELYTDPSCTDLALSEVVMGKPHGFNSVSLGVDGDFQWPGSSQFWSWRVRPFVYNFCQNGPNDLRWSTCFGAVDGTPPPATCDDVCATEFSPDCPVTAHAYCMDLCLCELLEHQIFATPTPHFGTLSASCCQQAANEGVTYKNGYSQCACPVGSP